MKPDATIKVRFLTTAEGGRNTAVEGQFYACPLLVDDEAFDGRLLLDGKRLELGKGYELPVKFLNRDLALQKLVSGKEVHLWEGRVVAVGIVIGISD